MKTLLALIPVVCFAGQTELLDSWRTECHGDQARALDWQNAPAYVLTVTNPAHSVTNAATLPKALTDAYIATLQALNVYGMDPSQAMATIQAEIENAPTQTARDELQNAAILLASIRDEIRAAGCDPNEVGPCMGSVVEVPETVTTTNGPPRWQAFGLPAPLPLGDFQ